MTQKRVVRTVNLLWVLSCFLPAVSFPCLIPAELLVSVWSVCFICTTSNDNFMFSALLCCKTPKKPNSSFTSTTSSAEWWIKRWFKVEKKNCTKHILCVFCLLTMLSAEILFSCLQGNHQYDSPFELFSICSRIIMLLNSSLNPVIYYWRMRHIRRAIMDIGRNINRSLYCGWLTRKKMHCWSDDMFLIEVP